MAEIELVLKIDPEQETIRIEGEHSLLFYHVWQRMMSKAKAEALQEAIDIIFNNEDAAAVKELMATYTITESSQ